MPTTGRNPWSGKDERQYEHVKQSERDAGRSLKRAKEIAARTVNKQRSADGRSEASGHSAARLPSRTRDELYQRAVELNISGRSKMNKAELVAAIRKRQ